MYEPRIMPRKVVYKTYPAYTDILDAETHHNHKIIMDEGGIIRWKEKPVVREMVDAIGLNEIIVRLNINGFDKNSEIYRKIYRGLGYSLYGYWEIFYWEANNHKCEED